MLCNNRVIRLVVSSIWCQEDMVLVLAYLGAFDDDNGIRYLLGEAYLVYEFPYLPHKCQPSIIQQFLTRI